jgi:cytochrome c oxidase subunit I+III
MARAASFIVEFVIGGVSGFKTGTVPSDWRLTDTYFIAGARSAYR